MDKIKDFFAKKKYDAKFKRAGKYTHSSNKEVVISYKTQSVWLGEGHRLSEPVSQKPASNSSTSSKSQPRAEVPTSAAQQQAAAAALARLEKRKEPTQQQRSAALIRQQVYLFRIQFFETRSL